MFVARFVVFLTKRLKEMAVNRHIIDYASRRDGPFKRRDIADYLQKEGILNEASLPKQIERLVLSGTLEKAGWGKYVLSSSVKPSLLIRPAEETLDMGRALRVRYPLADFCIWDASSVTPFMLHVPNVDMVIVDVERSLEQTFFDALREMYPQHIVLPDPSREDYYKYGSGKKTVIVHPLTTEAPVDKIEGFFVPTVEKMLVDVAVNPEFDFAEGRDMRHIYGNILADYDVSESKLFRYARRRGCEERVKQLMNPEYSYD